MAGRAAGGCQLPHLPKEIIMAELTLNRLFVLSDGSRVRWRHGTNQWEVIDVEDNRAAVALVKAIDETVRHAILTTAKVITP